MNNKINKIYERVLRLAYNNRQSTFDGLVDTDKSFSIHNRNLQVLATGISEVHPNFDSDFMNIFRRKNKKSCNQCSFTQRNIKSVYYGSETISYLGPKIWNLVPKCIKVSENLIFKSISN